MSRIYNADKHCGATVEIDPVKVQAKLDGYNARIAELRELQLENKLSRGEEFQLGKKVKLARFAEIKLQRIAAGTASPNCTNVKGQGTDHKGAGLCRNHCECRGREDFHSQNVYSHKTRGRKLRQLMDEMEQSGQDVLDLTPDLILMRAKIRMFLETKEQDNDLESIRSLTALNEQVRRMIETVNNRRFQSMVSLEMFNLILFKMAEVVMKHISDQDLLDKIQADWDRVKVGTLPKKRVSIGQGSIVTR